MLNVYKIIKLKDIIYRQNVPIEERKFYDKLMNDTAEVGNQITL